MLTGQCKSHARMPAVWLMTDERVAEVDLMRAIRRLPRGSAVVFRHYRLSSGDRRALFGRVRKECARRGCRLLLAGTPGQARAWGADGHHGYDPARRGKPWLHSAPVHDQAQLRRALRARADVVLVSPLFATRSHPGTRPLGPYRFAALARSAPVCVIALGGVRPRHARLVGQLGADGFAAIDGLLPVRRPT